MSDMSLSSEMNKDHWLKLRNYLLFNVCCDCENVVNTITKYWVYESFQCLRHMALNPVPLKSK